MNKILLLVALAFGATLSFSAEISAFDAGNLNSANPYGLTDSEKAVLSNKRSVQNIEANMGSVQEQLQGMQSIIESMSQRMNKLEQRMSELEYRVNGDANSSGTNLASLKAYIDETREIQDKNYKNISATLKQLGALIDKKATTAPAKGKTQSNLDDGKKSDFTSKVNKDIMSDAIKLLNADKTAEAAEQFDYLLKKNYKPASSNFYLGEVAYKQKSYSTAIQYYQKSIEANDKADYMPKLLYHTAISFDKVGDTSQANRFYKALKVGYPDSKEAKASPTRN